MSYIPQSDNKMILSSWLEKKKTAIMKITKSSINVTNPFSRYVDSFGHDSNVMGITKSSIWNGGSRISGIDDLIISMWALALILHMAF